MAASLQTQARSIEDLRATIAAQAETIRGLRAGNERLEGTLAVHTETIEMLKAEIRQLRRLPGKPDVKPGAGDGDSEGSGGKGLEGDRRSSGASKKRRGPRRGRKDAKRVVLSVPDAPEGSRRKDYQDYHAQPLELDVHNVIFMRERVVTPDGRIIVAELPEGVIGGFNLELHRFVLMLCHQGQSTTPRIAGLLDAIGLDISERQVRRIPSENREPFIGEAAEILKAGPEGAAWISVDDTGARHQGHNGYCTAIGNDRFGWFGTTGSKSRLSFLDTMCGALDEYILNDEAFRHMESHGMPRRALDALRGHAGSRFDGPDLWMPFLDGLGSTPPRPGSSPPRAPGSAVCSRTACCTRTAPSRATTPASSTWACTSSCAGSMPRGSAAPCRSGATRAVRPSMRCAATSGGRTGCLVPVAASQPPADAPSSSAASRAPSGPAPATACPTSRSRAPSPTATSCSPCSIAPRSRPTPTAPRTTCAAVSSAAGSRVEPARIKAVPAATPSSPT